MIPGRHDCDHIQVAKLMNINPHMSDQDPIDPTKESPLSSVRSAHWPSIDGYTIVREVARAGQGIVYQAIQKSTNQVVALKTLRDDHYLSEPLRQELDKAFRLEIELIAQLKHPNIISIHDAGTTDDGRPFYAMEFINGKQLGEYVDEHERSMLDMLRLFRTVCEAVDYAHQKGVTHFDLKPSNILVDLQGTVKVLDFGIARPLLIPGEPNISDSGGLFGTLWYMSPEQTHGNRSIMDVRTDVYSLGVVLYELLTGGFPYPVPPEATFDETIEHIRGTSPTAPVEKWTAASGIKARPGACRRPGDCPINKDISAIVITALAKSPERRYHNAGEFARAVERYINDEPINPDELWDALRHRGRKAVQRHRFAFLGGVIILVAVLSNLLIVPILYRWPQTSNFFFKLESALLPAEVKEFDFDHVRVIALQDDTPVEEIARDAGLKDVTVENRTSLRRLHGRLMENLAASGCSTVVWDIGFDSKSDFDKDFVIGVLKLREVGIDVVVTSRRWWLGENDQPALAEEILHEVRVGSSVAHLDESFPWVVMFYAQRGEADPLPSLSLEGFAAARYPGSNVDIHFDSSNTSLDLLYWTSPEGRNSKVKRRLGKDHIMLTDTFDRIDMTPPSPPRYPGCPELLDTDAIGMFYVAVPSNAKLAAATVPYQTAFRSDREKLQSQFAGKVVIVSDQRGITDLHQHPDGRPIAGCYAHAAVIESIFRRAFVQMVNKGEESTSAWIGALLGCSAAVTLAGSALRRYLALSGLTIAFVAASLFACWWFHYLLNPPLIPIAALWISSELSVAALRIWQTRRE
ncbi:MAG: protein kinase [Planctomycetes bacterium]|nr:protein kinase [Planctomycetota bacterium]